MLAVSDSDVLSTETGKQHYRIIEAGVDGYPAVLQPIVEDDDFDDPADIQEDLMDDGKNSR